MDKIILIGGGGHCYACIDVIEQERKYQIAGIVERDAIIDAYAFGYPIIGSDEDLIGLKNVAPYALVTVGQITNSTLRKDLFNKLIAIGYQLPTIISPRSYIARDVVVGDGTIIMHDALINSGSRIGKNCIINTKSLIEHNSIIGDNSHISTNAVVNGGVSIGNGVFVGSNATLVQSRKVPDNSFIKASHLYVGSNYE